MTLNVCKRKRGCPYNAYGELNEEYFVGVKLSCCTPPQKFESYFLHMEISIRPHVFFQFKAIVCMRINLIRLSKHPLIITKTWNFTKNKRYHSLKLKMEFTDHVTVSFTIIYCKGLNLSSKQTLPQPGAKNTISQALSQASPLPVLVKA